MKYILKQKYGVLFVNNLVSKFLLKFTKIIDQTFIHRKNAESIDIL